MADISKIKLLDGTIYNLKDSTAIPAPSAADSGAFLIWDGNDWVAQNLSVLVAIDNDSSSSDPTPSGGSISPYTLNPASLGVASPGVSNNYARGDHVHPMPTSTDIGAIPAPNNPTSGAFLVWDGSAWVAQTLTAWQGGSY